MVELDDKTVAETKTCTHNFAPDLSDPTVTILSQSFVKSQIKSDVGATVDGGAAALTIGTSQAVAQKVLVLYGAGLQGNQYECRAKATCSDGQVLENVVRFFVRDSAA